MGVGVPGLPKWQSQCCVPLKKKTRGLEYRCTETESKGCGDNTLTIHTRCGALALCLVLPFFLLHLLDLWHLGCMGESLVLPVL